MFLVALSFSLAAAHMTLRSIEVSFGVISHLKNQLFQAMIAGGTRNEGDRWKNHRSVNLFLLMRSTKISNLDLTLLSAVPFHDCPPTLLQLVSRNPPTMAFSCCPLAHTIYARRYLRVRQFWQCKLRY